MVVILLVVDGLHLYSNRGAVAACHHAGSSTRAEPDLLLGALLRRFERRPAVLPCSPSESLQRFPPCGRRSRVLDEPEPAASRPEGKKESPEDGPCPRPHDLREVALNDRRRFTVGAASPPPVVRAATYYRATPVELGERGPQQRYQLELWKRPAMAVQVGHEEAQKDIRRQPPLHLCRIDSVTNPPGRFHARPTFCKIRLSSVANFSRASVRPWIRALTG